MDQLKIGRFISNCRKAKGLTQMQLAERLNITDRAVSKWETGRALPDASIMLDLCSLLEISVNDLLSGEVVAMENYNKELENKLIEMVKQKEEADKRLLRMEVVIGVLSVIVLFVPLFIAAYAPLEDWQRVILIFTGFIPAIVGFAYAMKLEQVAGYYKCRHCGHTYVPELKAMYKAPHMGRTRYMKCPNCGKKSWQKKVLNRE
ncbi:MAG: helix-turn-helix domain-containing protein [Clostridia bacterium]|nr:helix-turn-helix domain-containing protein [Clostridia bacterium]